MSYFCYIKADSYLNRCDVKIFLFLLARSQMFMTAQMMNEDRIVTTPIQRVAPNKQQKIKNNRLDHQQKTDTGTYF